MKISNSCCTFFKSEALITYNEIKFYTGDAVKEMHVYFQTAKLRNNSGKLYFQSQ